MKDSNVLSQTLNVQNTQLGEHFIYFHFFSFTVIINDFMMCLFYGICWCLGVSVYASVIWDDRRIWSQTKFQIEFHDKELCFGKSLGIPFRNCFHVGLTLSVQHLSIVMIIIINQLLLKYMCIICELARKMFCENRKTKIRINMICLNLKRFTHIGLSNGLECWVYFYCYYYFVFFFVWFLSHSQLVSSFRCLMQLCPFVGDLRYYYCCLFV